MTAAERKHIAKVGEAVFNRARDEAWLQVMQDGRLRSAFKLREALTLEMALRATGFPARAFSLGKKANEKRFGWPTQEMQDVVDEHLRKARLIDAH